MAARLSCSASRRPRRVARAAHGGPGARSRTGTCRGRCRRSRWRAGRRATRTRRSPGAGRARRHLRSRLRLRAAGGVALLRRGLGACRSGAGDRRPAWGTCVDAVVSTFRAPRRPGGKAVGTPTRQRSVLANSSLRTRFTSVRVRPALSGGSRPERVAAGAEPAGRRTRAPVERQRTTVVRTGVRSVTRGHTWREHVRRGARQYAAAVSADLQPMAVRKGDPGLYAPLADAPAVEAVLEAAGRCERGAGAPREWPARTGRVPELLRGSLAARGWTPGVEVEWRRAVRRSRSCGGWRPRSRTASSGAETAVGDADWERLPRLLRRVGRQLEGRDAGGAARPGRARDSRPRSTRRRSGAATWTASAPERRGSRSGPPRWPERCAVVAGAGRARSLPEPLAGARLRRSPPGIDPLNPRNLELEPRLPGRVVRAAGRGPRPPVRASSSCELDRWKDPHATIEALRASRARSSRASSSCWRPQLETGRHGGWRAAKEVRDYAGGHGGPAAAHELRGRWAASSWARSSSLPAWCSSCRCGEGFGLGRLRGAVEAHAGGGRPRTGGLAAHGARRGGRLPHATARRRPRGGSWSWSAIPGLAIEMGRAGRERVRGRFLVTRAERELRALVELA